MKRTLFTAVLFIIAGALIFAQNGDARTMGLSNAFTAVADDVNAITFNPAGLGFLKKETFTIDGTISAQLTKKILSDVEEYPEIQESWEGIKVGDSEIIAYTMWDDFLSDEIFFDPALYGFPWDKDVPENEETGYLAAVRAYEEFRNYYGVYEFNRNVSDLKIYPRIAWAGKYFGVSTLARISADMLPTEYEGEYTPVTFRINKDLGLVGAVGLKLGVFGIGANFKYYERYTEDLTYMARDFEDGPSEDFLTDLVLGKENSTVEPIPQFELGLGGLFTLGSLSVGAYLDNAIFFVNDIIEEKDIDWGGILDTLNVGAAWTPFNNKLEEKRGILNLVAAIDLKNFGDEEKRGLAIGLEAGLNLGDFITADARAGFTQNLPGSLTGMFRNFDWRDGLYTAGIGAKFWFMRLDAAVQFPAELLFNPPVEGYVPKAEWNDPFGKFYLNASFSF